MKKTYHALPVALAAALLFTACGNGANTNTDTGTTTSANTAAGANTTTAEGTGNEAAAAPINTASAEESGLFSDRDLRGTYDAASCSNITLADGGCTTDSQNVAISKNNGTDTVTITGEGDYIVSGALGNGMIIVEVEKTEKVQLVLNGVNIQSATSAAIYVKSADKVFVTLAEGTENTLANGGSFVAIDDNNIDGAIFSKDDLTLNGTGKLTVSSPGGHGIVSKNELTITGGTYDVTASSHGMSGKDSIAIAEGTFRVTAGEDAIKSDNNDDTTMGSIYIFGGNYQLSAVSDGMNALNEINISGGNIIVEKSDEGLEARVINISGGETDVTSSDDGLNATDKRAATTASQTGTTGFDVKNAANGNRGQGFGGGMDEAGINISGGIVRINAEGDGLDSNGHLTVSGGEVYVAGPLSNGDSALDYDIDATISGGIVVAAGQGGMAQNFGSNSTQGTILINTEQQNGAGSLIALLDSSGNTLVSWTAQKSYQSVVVSCPAIKVGETYTVRMGETDTTVTMEELVYGQGGQFGGHGGGGMKGGTKPERTQPPSGGAMPENMPTPPGPGL